MIMHMHRFQPVNRDSLRSVGGGHRAVGLAGTALRFRRAKPAAGGPELRPPRSDKEGYQSTGFDKRQHPLRRDVSWSTALRMLKLALMVMQGALPVHMCWVPAHR